MTDDDKLRRFAKQMVETARGLKRLSETPAMRELLRWQQLIREAEFEAGDAGLAGDIAPQATAVPNERKRARAAEDDEVREVLRDINKEHEGRLNYWPSGRDAWPIAKQRVRVKKKYFLEIASEDEFKLKRRTPADH